jgi:adenosine deaminase
MGPYDLGDLTRLEDLSKIDLHRHLEGCVRLSTIVDLAREAGVALPAETLEDLARTTTITRPVAGLDEALAAFAPFQASFRSLDAARRIAREAVEDLDADNVRLAELRFSPAFMCGPAGLDWDAAMDAVVAGVEEARAAGADVAVGLICIVSRDLGLEAAGETVAFALAHRDRLVGFDIAGPELGSPPAMWAEVVRPISDAGMHLTTHYGESGPPEYPRDAIQMLATERLGHGVSVAADPAITRLAAEQGVALEMCPTSNWLTRAVPSVAEHPARRLLHEGVRVTINTDNPGLMGIDLTNEYRLARTAMGFSYDDLRTAVRNALDASFLPPAGKADVRRRHFAWAG